MSRKEVYEFVDKSLTSLKEADLMFLPDSDMPKEMIDSSVNKKEDWIPWKGIKSIVNDKDILELENKIELKYPELYKDFLKYKHFYELENIEEISFYRHCIRDWKKDLLEVYFEYWEPEVIIKKGFIPFANYSDWGIVCFDTNRMNNSESPIVMFDHETLYENPVPYQDLYENFELMVKELLKELKNE